MSDALDRLDSWKAIADYLNRDIRTLRRWEAQGLPVRRVAGAKGNSVFAFKSEIDAWLKVHEGPRPAAAPPPPAPAPAPVPAAGGPLTPTPAMRRDRGRQWRYFSAAAIIVVAVLGWKTWAPSARGAISVSMTKAELIATDATGTERWRYEFPLDVTNELSNFGGSPQVVGGQDPMVLAMSSFLVRRPDDVSMSGVLRAFSMEGRLLKSVTLDDTWSFAGRTFSAPWAMTDFRVEDAFGRRQIALAAHHFMWWPSVVTILDERLQRQGTFVNAGWVDVVRWMSPDRLAIGGLSQPKDGGMLGVLDTHNFDGASPTDAGSPFACDNCRSAKPVFYAVFPRSEINTVTGSPFNRAGIEVSERGVIAHTYEMPSDGTIGMVEAVYEFSSSLELQSATYGSRYWDKHRALELAGKINHTRENCPDKNGPPFVWIWTPDTGWKKVVPKR